MQWFSKAKPPYHTRRTRRKFLLLPRTFGRETRWLEYANIVEEFQSCPDANWSSFDAWVEVDFEDPRTPFLEKIEKGDSE